MAGSTESMARMGVMVKNVSSQECPQGYEGIFPDCKKILAASTKQLEEAIVITNKDPNALKEGELTNWEKEHGKLSKKDKKTADRLSLLSAQRYAKKQQEK